MDSTIISLISTLITSSIGFLFGSLNTNLVTHRKTKEYQLENIYAPIMKTISTCVTEEITTTEIVNSIYKIVREHYQYVPSELSDNVIALKELVNENKITSLSKNNVYKEIMRFVVFEYCTLTKKLSTNITNYSHDKDMIWYINKAIFLSLLSSFTILTLTFYNLFEAIMNPNSLLLISISNLVIQCSLIFLKRKLDNKEMQKSSAK